MKERRDSAAGELKDWFCFITSEFVLRMFARNVSAEQFFFRLGRIVPFDGFVNLGCGREADHPMQPPWTGQKRGLFLVARITLKSCGFPTGSVSSRATIRARRPGPHRGIYSADRK